MGEGWTTEPLSLLGVDEHKRVGVSATPSGYRCGATWCCGSMDLFGSLLYTCELDPWRFRPSLMGLVVRSGGWLHAAGRRGSADWSIAELVDRR